MLKRARKLTGVVVVVYIHCDIRVDLLCHCQSSIYRPIVHESACIFDWVNFLYVAAGHNNRSRTEH